METLVKAAIKQNGVVYTGRRHNEIIFNMVRAGIVLTEAVQGFLTSEDRFLTRNEALKVAIAAGQVRRENIKGGTLTSENLW